MFESQVKQDLSQSPEGARRPAAKLSIMFYSYSPDGATCLAQPTLYRLKIANFPYPLSFSTFVPGDPLRIYGKALQVLKLESSSSWRWRFGDPSLHRFWLIHPCDGRTDKQTDRQTDRIATAKMCYSSSCCWA